MSFFLNYLIILQIILIFMQIIFEQIGTIYSPFKTKEGMPIQPSGANGVKGKIVLEKNIRKV